MSTPMKPIFPLRKKMRKMQNDYSRDLVEQSSLLPVPPLPIQSSSLVREDCSTPQIKPNCENDKNRNFRPIKEEPEGPFNMSDYNQSKLGHNNKFSDAFVHVFEDDEKEFTRTIPNKNITKSSQYVNEFDRFIYHEDFVRFVEMAYKVKVMRHTFASGNPNIKPNLDISNLCKDSMSKKPCHDGDGFADTVSFIRKSVSSKTAHDESVSEQLILRGVYPRTDGLLNDAIDSLVKEFERCKLYHSELKKRTILVPEIRSPSSNGRGGNSEENKIPERPIRSPRKKKKKGESTKEAIAVKYSKHQTDILTEWMIQHKSHPFPNSAQIKALCEATHLNYSQVVNWTTNVRKRNLKATVEGGKKPHHFLDFLFLADHRDKNLLKKNSVDISKKMSKGAPKKYNVRNGTTTKLPKKTEKRSLTTKSDLRYKTLDQINRISQGVPTGNNPSLIDKGIKKLNRDDSRSSSYLSRPNENPHQSIYPPYFFSVQGHPFSRPANGDTFHPPFTTYHSPNVYQTSYENYRYGSQEAINYPYIHENNRRDKRFDSVSPSFDEQCNGDKREINYRKQANNIVSPEYPKNRQDQKTNLNWNAEKNSKLRFSKERKTQVEPINYPTYDPLDPDAHLWRRAIDANSKDLGSKLMQLCKNLGEDDHHEVNDNQWNESQVLHRFTKDGILSTPPCSDDELWEESSLQDLSVESEGVDLFYSNPFDDQHNHVPPKYCFETCRDDEGIQNHDQERRNAPCMDKEKEEVMSSNSFPLDTDVVGEDMDEWLENELNEHIESADNFLDFLDSIPTAHAEV